MNFLDPRLPDRFWDKCIPEPMSGCWLWTAGSTGDDNGQGYGRFRINGKETVAHRVSCAALVGHINAGLEVDHLCKVTLCVNPAHLEPVTPRINKMRSGCASSINAQKSECPAGHSLVDAYRHGGRRYCRLCRNEYFRARRANQRSK